MDSRYSMGAAKKRKAFFTRYRGWARRDTALHNTITAPLFRSCQHRFLTNVNEMR
jgi:hypothetical protein